MHKSNIVLRRIFIFLVLISILGVTGVTYSSWNSNLWAGAKMTSGAMDVMFNTKTDGKYAVYITEKNGSNGNLIGAEFFSTDKVLEISFTEGLPINALIEGKLLKLEFPLDYSEHSTVNKLNLTKLDLTKTGEIIEMQADSALLVYDGNEYSIGEDEAAFREPLQFEVYKTVSEEDDNDTIGCIYLKLQEDSKNRIAELPLKITLDKEEIDEDIDSEIPENSVLSSVGNGILVTYSCEIPFEVFQNGEKVQESED